MGLGSRGGGGEQWSESGDILKVESIDFMKRFGVWWQKSEGWFSQVFGLSNWEDRIAVY